MNIEKEILINQFGQGVSNEDALIKMFDSLDSESKVALLKEIENLIIQSKVTEKDIDKAIYNSKLKETFTPCVILKRGLNYGNFQKVIHLPDNEIKKTFRLLIHLFKIGYYRRYLQEKNNPNKWWYWDLSDEMVIKKIMENIS
ncbi:DUF5958 family protein [Pontibacter pudoricolor]|uniref:DUF5958 family protein n=1 Tax=Pontibacter pudoricolor TaxID=2694930 RepID=UPI00139078AD|nr:DUF5958 family protein [Pontibacter pudoricolor]